MRNAWLDRTTENVLDEAGDIEKTSLLSLERIEGAQDDGPLRAIPALEGHPDEYHFRSPLNSGSFHAIVGARSMRYLASMLSGLVLVVAALFLSECGSQATGTCVSGQSISCAGNGCTGFQVCTSDGKAYGECVCGSVAFPATGPNSGLLGAACTSAASFRKGFDCITSDSRLINRGGAGAGPSA